MLAAGAAMAVSGTIGASSAPVSAPETAVAPADTGLVLAKQWRKHHGGGGGNHGNFRRHRGHHGGNGIWFGAPFLAAPFLYNGYGYDGDYGYSSYNYGYSGGNSCYRACRYEHGPRYCRHNWEDYC